MTTPAIPARLAIEKRLLFGPGPSMVEPGAYQAMSYPVLGIRDPQFLKIMDQVRASLRTVFGTANHHTFTVPSSGSGAMEAAVSNFVLPGSTFAVLANGHFSNRLITMGQRQKAKVAVLSRPWGEVFEASEAAEFFEQERPDVVAFVQGETSSGAYQSGHWIAAAARKVGALVMGDCVTTLGAMPVNLDQVGVDVAFSCTQKGLSSPAGLAPISISPRAWDRLQGRADDTTTWYLDLRLMAKYFDPPHTYQHTPSPPLYYALHQSLAAIEEEGLENRWVRHKRIGTKLMAGLVKLGFEPLVRHEEDRTWHLAVVRPPVGVDEAAFRQRLVDRFGIEVGAGLGELAGKVVRMGTMGPLATDENVDSLLQAVAESL